MTARRALSIGVLLLPILAGCSTAQPTGPTTTPTPASRGALAEFDVCTVLTPEQSHELGLYGPGERYNVYPETGCHFRSDALLLTLGRNIEDDGFSSYRSNADRYVEFELNTVGGRDGARIVDGESGDICHQVVAAGRGHVIVQVLVRIDYEDVLDSCTEAYRIAEMIAPQLPEVGG